MSIRRSGLLKAALNALHFTGADGLLSPLTRGVGVIFVLHRVRPAIPDGSGPSRILEVEPQFLDETIRCVLDRGFEVLSLDDVHGRLSDGDFDRPFACFTFDDGYRDNHEHAYPIFRSHGLPFAIYVPTDFPDGRGDLWWLKLEMVLAEAAALEIKMNGVWSRFEMKTASQKDKAFDRIYGWLRGLPEAEARGIVGELCHVHGIDTSHLCSDLIMTWQELRELARDPLVTIGAHTRRHLALAKLTRSEARLEINESVRRLEAELGRPIRHFSFPYGDEASAGQREFDLARELGLVTAVTTRKGHVHVRHTQSMTALPRVSLNGDCQHTRYVKVMLSGAPFSFRSLAQRFPLGQAARLTARSGARPAADTSSG